MWKWLLGEWSLWNGYEEMITLECLTFDLPQKWLLWKLLLGNDYLENNYFEMITKKWLLLAYYIQNDYLGTDYLKWLLVDFKWWHLM